MNLISFKSAKMNAAESVPLAKNALGQLKSGGNFSTDIFSKSYTPEPFETPCEMSFLERIKFDKKTKNLLPDTKKYVSAQEEEFYSKDREVREIYTFEQNKKLLNAIISKIEQGDKNFKKFYEPQYKEILLSLTQKAMAKEEDFEFAGKRRLSKELDCSFEYKDAYKIFFSQFSQMHPDLAALEAKITPRKVEPRSLDSYDDEKSAAYIQFGLDYLKGVRDEKRDKFLLELFLAAKDLDVNSTFVKKLEDDELCAVAYNFAIAAYNTLEKTGNAYVEEAAPALFEGMDEKEVFKKLDVLSSILRGSQRYERSPEHVVSFKIGGKDFLATPIGAGEEGAVYRLTDPQGQNPVVLKVYCDNNMVSAHGVFGNMAVHRDASKAGCVDVPKFYMGNPLSKPVLIGDKKDYIGAWQITGDANFLPKKIKDGLKVIDWLNENNLAHYDGNKDDARVNGYMIDFGFVAHKNAKQRCSYETPVNEIYGSAEMNHIFEGYKNGTTTLEFIEHLK